MTAGPYEGDRFQTIVFDPNDATKVIVSDAFGGIYYSSDSGENFTEHSVYQGASAKKNKINDISKRCRSFLWFYARYKR
jgi:hypothetical protein